MAVAVLHHHLPFQESVQSATWIKESADQIAPLLCRLSVMESSISLSLHFH